MAKYNYATTKNIIMKENLQSKPVKAKVVRVQDGDTIYVTSSDPIFKGTEKEFDGTYSIRLSGVQAPEGTSFWDMEDDKSGLRDYDDYRYTGYEEKDEFSEESFLFMKDLLLGKEVILDLRTKENGSLITGRFSRPIAIIFAKMGEEYVNANVSLLTNSLGTPYYVEAMNLSDSEKKEWSNLSIIADMLKMEEETEKIEEDLDEFVGSFDPETNIKIGDSILPIPPEAIVVNDINEVNPTSVIRGGSTLMSSTGHRQKQVQMEFYFDSNKRTKELIKGRTYEGDQINGFPKLAAGKSAVIMQDGEEFRPVYYINGLRPLMAQFKLTPFLPIENEYLNKTHDISALTLQNLSISNVEGFPGLVKATLIALEFNHEAYINMVGPFKDVFDWGLFRFYYQRLIDGTGIKHRGTKLPFYQRDGEDFSFFTVDSWSLQKRENLEASLEDVLREYQIDLEEGSTEYEKLVFEYEVFTEALEQYELFNELKGSYNLNNEDSKKELYLEYIRKIADKQERRNDSFNDGLYYEPNIHNELDFLENGRLSRYDNLIEDLVKIEGYDGDYFDIALRSEKNKEFLINYLKQKEEDNLIPTELDLVKSTEKEIERIKEANSFNIKISRDSFLYIKDRVIAGGKDLLKEREEAVSMTDNQMDDYEWNKHYYSDLHLNQINVSMSNGVNTVKLNMHTKPTHQYLGSKDIVISTSFVTDNEHTLESINFLASHTSAMELRYKKVLDNPVMKVQNNIVDMFGLDGAYIKNIETNTVPSMPGLFQIEISFFGYIGAPGDKDSLSLQYRSELGVDGKMGHDNLTDYFNMKERLKYINLYPDLELPRYSELPLRHELFDANDDSFVDPDFYALDVPKVFSEDVIRALYDEDDAVIIGRDTEGNAVRALVDDKGNINLIDSNIQSEYKRDSKPTLADIAYEKGDVGYNELSEFMDNRSLDRSNMSFVSDKELKSYLSSEDKMVSNVKHRKIKISDFWESYVIKWLDSTVQKDISEIERIIAAGFIVGNWDKDYIDDDYLEFPKKSLYRNSSGELVDELSEASYYGVLNLNGDNLNQDVKKKIASNYRASILKYELESGKIYDILKEKSPQINFDRIEGTGVSNLYENYSKRESVDYMFKMLSYFLVKGISLNDISNYEGGYPESANNVKEAYLGFEKSAKNIIGSKGIYINPTEMIDMLPNFAMLIKKSLESINGDNFVLTSEGTYMQSRREDVRFASSFNDMLEYDRKGRLIRAFPSYYMLLIDEGREFMFWKMQDLFYHYNGVQSIDVVRDKKNISDTCMITMSNSKGRLSDASGGYRNKYYQEKGVMETLWSLTPFAEFEWEKAKRNSEFESVQLATGARLHLRMGYGSTPDKLPTVFNGTITELQLGDTITFVAQNDGIELNKPIPASPNEKTDFDILGQLDEPRTIISKIVGDRGNLWSRFMNNISGNLLYNESAYGIQHFGEPKRPEWWDESQYLTKRHPITDIYINQNSRSSDKMERAVRDEERTYEVTQNINSSLYENKDFSMYLYGKTVWDVLETCALVAPNYIAAVHPFAFRNTIFFGHPNFDLAYDYEAEMDEKGNYIREESKEEEVELSFTGNGTRKTFELRMNIIEGSLEVRDGDKKITDNIDKIDHRLGRVIFSTPPKDDVKNVIFTFKTLVRGKIEPLNVREKLKSYRQNHFYSSYYDIIANNIRATEKNMYTAVKPVLSKDGIYKELDEMFVDTDIFPDRQRLKKIDTSIPTPDFVKKFTNTFQVTSENAEINARRYGAGALKQAVENMYDGEIVVTGDPSVKPYDYGYLADVRDRISGTFEVSSVVHSLNDTTGFVTSINPSPVVSVNEGLQYDKDFWKWTNSKFSSLYANSVVARLSTYTALASLKSVLESLKITSAAGSLLPATNAGMAATKYLDVTTDALKHSNLGYLPFLLGKNVLERIKDLGTKTDKFVIWVSRFLDNANKMSDISKLGGKGLKNVDSLRKMMISGKFSSRAQKISDGLNDFRNGYVRMGEYLKTASRNADDFPGFMNDMRKYSKLRKSGMKVGDILDDVRVFRRLTTYGLSNAKDVAKILSGPMFFLVTEVVEFVIVSHIMKFLKNMRANREVLTIMPLKRDGKEFTAGLEGHKGCIIGDDPSKMDKFWDSSIINFFIGKSEESISKDEMRQYMIDNSERITNSASLYGAKQNSEMTRKVMGVTNIDDVKGIYKDSYNLNFTKEIEEEAKEESKKKEVEDAVQVDKNNKDEGKKKTQELKSIYDIKEDNRIGWSMKASLFVKDNPDILADYKGHKVHPKIITLFESVKRSLGSTNVRALVDGKSFGSYNEDKILYDNGLAIRFEPRTGEMDINDTVKIIKEAAVNGFGTVKVFKDNSVQVDLFPLFDNKKLKSDTYNKAYGDAKNTVSNTIDDCYGS